MNHCVPEFEIGDDYSIPASSSAEKRKSSGVGAEDEIMELLWQDGEVVMQKSGKKVESASAREENQRQNQHLFMEEDEMASWLHYPLNDAGFDQDFCADLLYPNTTSSTATAVNAPPPRPPDTASFVAAARNKAVESPGCSSASADDRKRKGPSHHTHDEDAEFESADANQQARGSTSTKRARAAEVHNLSERRRRDRINEKMKALQELIPRCNKSDKASMLDEAIEYLKSLQLQVQMMSMGCSMVPMMFPGMQQYMPPMGLGMGMGMGMEMGMNRPMMHFANVLPGSAMPPATAAPGHLGPRFPMPPPFPMPPVPATPDQSRVQGNNQSDTVQINNPLSMQNPNQPRIPHFADPYHQYLGLHQMHLPPPPQNQGMAQPSTSRGGAEDPENDQPG